MTSGVYKRTEWHKSRIKNIFKKGHTVRLGKIGYKQTEEHIKKALQRRVKSSLEIKFEGIIKKLNLPYEFVGNGEIIIGGKNPDFVNVNGEKIAIETYYRKHKEQFRGGLENWKSNREVTFKEYGWKLIFFDETQVNKNNIIECLGLGD